MIFILILVVFGTSLILGNNEFWLGTQDCDGSRKTCEVLGLNFVETSIFGPGWIPCLNGRMVKCRLEGQPIPVKNRGTPLNICSLTFKFSYLKDETDYLSPDLETYDGHIEKSCRIPTYVQKYANQSDIVVVKNLFVSGCTEEVPMETMFKYYGWTYSYVALDLGLHIFSRAPIKLLKHEFLNSIEQGPKSNWFNSFLVNLNNEEYQLFVSKFSETELVKRKQYEKITEYMDNMEKKYEKVVKLYGDTLFVSNSHKKDLQKIYKYLKFSPEPMTPVEYCQVNTLMEWKSKFDKVCDKHDSFSEIGSEMTYIWSYDYNSNE